MKSNIRTIQEFVEDLASDGKNLNQILIVAAQTRWKNFKQEIKQEHQRLMR